MIVKKLLNITSNMVTVILILLLIFTTFIVIASKASGGEPNVFGYQLKTVLSGSMEPTFKTGSIIAIKPLENPTNLKTGDVITFKLDESSIATHRIVEVIKNKEAVLYKTKGDNNEEPDATPVLSQNVVGKYTGFTLPYIGFFQDFAKSKNGALLLLVLPGILLLIYSAVSIFRALREIDQTNKSNEIQKTI